METLDELQRSTAQSFTYMQNFYQAFFLTYFVNEEDITDLFAQLNIEKYVVNKLTLKDILETGPENVKDNKPVKKNNLFWCMLKKIMALDIFARSTVVDADQADTETSNNNDFFDIFQTVKNVCSIHPLDVLCALLHCSDSLLQQLILTNMAMCQFAVPLLLPAGDRSHCTFMLWAMRDIVKRWRPESLININGFREESVVNISMPFISFVRLGEKKKSKSKILNQVINPAQQHNFFIHDNMDGANTKRKISEGLVEVSWYFPSGKCDAFKEPFAVTNLRGDLESNWDQFMFLTQVSSAILIFIETIDERQVEMLSMCSQSKTNFYCIISSAADKDISEGTKANLRNLFQILRLDKSNVILKSKDENEAGITKKIQTQIQHILENCSENVTMPKSSSKNEIILKSHCKNVSMTDIPKGFKECQKARQHADRITKEISNVAEYKRKTMELQGELWKQLSKIEKEHCRMKTRGEKNAETHQSHLLEQCNSLHAKQYRHQVPKGMKLFIDALANLSGKERQYFLKWMKFNLDAIARQSLPKLQIAYKEKCNQKVKVKKELQDLDKEICDNSLGIEHFLRELGQFYEAECSMIKQQLIEEHQKKWAKLPGIAADLLLDGFPLELIDGDVSNIPLQWITDVLSELDSKTGRKCRMRIITVLGVQSTGKSTLLNTMFGLQFPVASGRCTRGAFMTLLKVKENFQEQLGCQFILVLDTEGLKAPELASLEESYEHDNELATLVVGLSDITIVNLSMENTIEMRDILQIVVHAFLRMDEIGKKPNCQFVHQNVSDVSAHDQNIRGRKQLEDQLNSMIDVAAKMEKKDGISKFTDVMDYDLEKDNWYIPGLWQGDPPMAPVNRGYNSHVQDLKMYLFKCMEAQKSSNKTSNISSFIIWIESLWKSVKYENFIFSFRNSLVAKAYNKLSAQYSLWEWDFCREIHNWVIRMDNKIKNQCGETCDSDTHELRVILLQEENKMTASLEKYFENCENANLIERYREEFKLSIKGLKNDLERKALSRYHETVSIQKGKIKLQNIQRTSQALIEEKITELLERYRQSRHEASEMEIIEEFESMWNKTLLDLPCEKLERRNVDLSILQLLINDMSIKGPQINEALTKIRGLYQYAELHFTMDKKYIEYPRSLISRLSVFVQRDYYTKIENLAASIISLCDEYIKEKAASSGDYEEIYCKELLNMINAKLLSKDVKKLCFTPQFVLHVKLKIFGKASKAFQGLHDKFIQENDPILCLQELKPQYLSTFLSIFQKKDECRSRAVLFCDRCLKPAMMQYIFKHLGQKIVDHILGDSDNITFSSRSFFQSTLLEELLGEMSFSKYVTFINLYESFTKLWILTYIRNKYQNSSTLQDLQMEILSSALKKIKNALQVENCCKSNTVSVFLEEFCGELKTDLVIPQNEMKVIKFHNLGNVDQFSSEVELQLTVTEQQIQSELNLMDIDSILSKLTLNPQDELFRKVIGCGKQCPFCKVPCEAGGGEHKKHFASVHRPQGLGQYRFDKSEMLVPDICSTHVVTDCTFSNSDTEGKFHPYKEYRTYYPEWAIQPDPSIESSDYWRFIFVQYNDQFAEKYKAKPAELPETWKQISKIQALRSLKDIFNMS
ncbi:up-regulator of cell proliferation-like [Hyperolius riggenbachi]|uniref:up-regulator of cell proliferation-like n=1 Tax=Hyperolius riggenbachi TaxID=752182 RepID=UPI0035A30554